MVLFSGAPRSTKIINGAVTENAEFPWHVALFDIFNDGNYVLIINLENMINVLLKPLPNGTFKQEEFIHTVCRTRIVQPKNG